MRQEVIQFWALDEAQHIYNRDDILPDANIEVVVNCGAPLVFETDNGSYIELPRVLINGVQQRPLKLRALGQCQLVGMRLYPWTLSALIGEQAFSTNTPLTGVSGEWQKFAQSLEKVVCRDGQVEAIAQFQDFVSGLCRRDLPDLTPIRSAVALLARTKGLLSIRNVAASCFLSQSQLERRFKQFMGVSPKTYARLIRFEAIRDCLLCDPTYSLYDLVYEFQFNDQAHFIHDFKSFAGCTPGQFAAMCSVLGQDAGFLQVP